MFKEKKGKENEKDHVKDCQGY